MAIELTTAPDSTLSGIRQALKMPDNFASVTHTHPMSGVDGLVAALSGKATAEQGGKADNAIPQGDAEFPESTSSVIVSGAGTTSVNGVYLQIGSLIQRDFSDKILGNSNII